METFGDRLKFARGKAGLTQKDLAQRLNTDSMNVSRWERGEVGLPEAGTLAPLAAALGVTTDWLLTGEDGPPGARAPIRPELAEFLERYPDAADFTDTQIQALANFAERGGVPITSWMDFVAPAKLMTLGRTSKIHQAKRQAEEQRKKRKR